MSTNHHHLTINIFVIPYLNFWIFIQAFMTIRLFWWFQFRDIQLYCSLWIMKISLISWKEIRFKGRGSCIDLILTNRKYSFKHTSFTETGLSDHLIPSTMKTTFAKEETKVLVYLDYKNCSFNSFKSELLSKFHHNNVTFTFFENNSVNVLNQQAPQKSKVFRGNQKPI